MKTPSTSKPPSTGRPSSNDPAQPLAGAVSANPPSTDPRWTPEQWTGISTVGVSLLVSAAAGSGKTAVLAERCAHLVCDAADPCNIDQLLVVTFTDSAAAEMKSRIHRAMQKRSSTSPTPHLARQLALVEHANVSTVHSFCARVLRQNFNLLGLDPAFVVMDPDEASLIRAEIVRELFEDRYESDSHSQSNRHPQSDSNAQPESREEHSASPSRDEKANPKTPPTNFHRLIDNYGNGNDARLMEQVISTHQLLCSLVDPQAWIDHARRATREAVDLPLEKSELGQKLLDLIRESLDQLHARAVSAAAELAGMGKSFAAYLSQVRERIWDIDHWRHLLVTDGLDSVVSEVHDFWEDVGRKPNVRNDTFGKDRASRLYDSVKDEITDGLLSELLTFTPAQWRQGMANVAPHAEAFLSLVSEFSQRYSAAKQAARALDFADLERLTLEVLKQPGEGLQPSEVARGFHHQFRHVLVDEYQDINEIQDAILTLVSRECIADERRLLRTGAAPQARKLHPNLFCVGDVKQSIFRFRLAEPQRFLDRQARFRQSSQSIGQVIDLRENFRSRGPLLEAINAVFARLMTRQAVQIEYDDSHRLRPGRIFPPAPAGACFHGAPIELHLLPARLGGQEAEEDGNAISTNPDLDRTDYEAILVARRIRAMMGLDGAPPMCVMKPDATGTLSPRPIEFGDIVILLRSMQFKADAFADVLRGHGIPVHSDGGAGFFNATEIRDILCLLQVLDNQQQDIPLAAVLRSPLAAIPDADDALARIRLKYRGDDSAAGRGGGIAGVSVAVDEVSAAGASAQKSSDPIPFHEAVRRYAAEQNDELAARLKDFLAELADYRDQANKRPVAELLWHIYDQTGYLAYCAGLEDGAQRVANLTELHERAGQFGSFLRQGLYRFLRFLEKLREGKEIPRPSVASGAESVVRILTIHRAKGLEFPVVILPDLGKRHNLQDATGAILVDRQAGLGMAVVDERRRIRYPSLASTLVRNSLHDQTLAEELRLLYVAMTRAKEHLILIGTCDDKRRDAWPNQWRNWKGPLPANDLLKGRMMLDWLGPVAAMTESAAAASAATTPSAAPIKGDANLSLANQRFASPLTSPPLTSPTAASSTTPKVFQIFDYDPAEVRAWENPRDHRPVFSPRQEMLAKLTPFPQPPIVDATAKKIIERFESAYPYEAFTKLAATKSVTAIAKNAPASERDAANQRFASPSISVDQAFAPLISVDRDPPETLGRKLDLPAFFSAVSAPKATDIGTITHLALQHWNFASPADPAEISRQIETLVDRNIITSTQARLVDRAALQWMLASDVGAILRASHDRLMREIPFALAFDDPSATPSSNAMPAGDSLDRVMIRGRIDLLVPRGDGLIVVDYKTDNVDEISVASRVEMYAGQMRFYRAAIERIAELRVEAVYLIFLTPRLIREC